MTLTNHTPIARGYDPPSSHRAAQQVRSSGQEATEAERCLAGLYVLKTATSKHIAQAFGMDRYTPGRRMSWLEKDKFYVERLPRAKHEDTRYQVTASGRAHLIRRFGDTTELTLSAVARGEFK